MNKELQDQAWAALPKEFKEEVKIYYDDDWGHDILVLEYLFGEHNITSYAKKDGTSTKPKHKVGDKVRISCVHNNGVVWDSIIHGRIATVKSAYLRSDNKIWIYRFEEAIRDLAEDWLEPYTEQGESNHSEKLNSSDEQLERRLNIAKDFAAVLLGRLDYNPFMAHINCCSDGKPVNPYRHMASIAMSVADALIAEAEKGGEKL